MKTLYLVLHENRKTEDIKCIGIYSSRQCAEKAVERLSTTPGFRDAPQCFSIDPYVLDRDHWSDPAITAKKKANFIFQAPVAA